MGDDGLKAYTPANTAQKMFDFFRFLRDSPLGLGARLLLGIFYARRQQKLVDSWSARLQIAPLKLKNFLPQRDASSTLFILGSGESVESLSPKNFAHIADHVSIGINAWPLHPFVADVYAFEPFDVQSDQYIQLFDTVLHEARFLEKSPELLLFRPQRNLDADRYLSIPDHLRKKAHLYGRFVPLSANLASLLGEIRSLHSLKKLHALGQALVMDLGATVIRMVSLGMLMGYRDIVLLGVDLNGGKYFWEKNPSRLSDRGLTSFSPGHNRVVHETMTRESKAFVLTEVLAELQRLMSQQGKTLWVGSGSSLLAEFLPVYGWESDKSHS